MKLSLKIILSKFPRKFKIIFSLLQTQKKFTIFLLCCIICCVYLAVDIYASKKTSQNTTPNTAPQKLKTTNYDYHLHPSEELHDPFSAAHPVKSKDNISSPQVENLSIQPNPELDFPKTTQQTVTTTAATTNEISIPTLTGIISNNGHRAILIQSNRFYTVQTGDHFSSFNVLFIDGNSVKLKNDDGQIITCRLKGF